MSGNLKVVENRAKRYEVTLFARFRIVGSIEWLDGQLINLSSVVACVCLRFTKLRCNKFWSLLLIQRMPSLGQGGGAFWPGWFGAASSVMDLSF